MTHCASHSNTSILCMKNRIESGEISPWMDGMPSLCSFLFSSLSIPSPLLHLTLSYSDIHPFILLSFLIQKPPLQPNHPSTMSQYDAHSISRATSLSRKSTVASRNASLIKKNTGPHELRPSDILIERFTGE